MIAPAKGAAVWSGRDLEGNSDWITPLSAEDLAEVSDALSVAQSKDIPVQEITPDSFPLDDEKTYELYADALTPLVAFIY